MWKVWSEQCTDLHAVRREGICVLIILPLILGQKEKQFRLSFKMGEMTLQMVVHEVGRKDLWVMSIPKKWNEKVHLEFTLELHIKQKLKQTLLDTSIVQKTSKKNLLLGFIAQTFLLDPSCNTTLGELRFHVKTTGIAE